MISLYGDIQSQPTRALWTLAECEKDRMGAFKRVNVHLSKLEQYDKDFKKINPVGKVPAFKLDGEGTTPDFNMFESHAIMKFICGLKQLPDHWYPTSPNRDLKLQARMDIYLDWHHANLRMGAGGYLFRKYFSALMDKDGVGATEESIKESWKILNRSLQQIERIWLKPDRGYKFMFSDKPSIADLSLACELTQLEAIKFPLHKFP